MSFGGREQANNGEIAEIKNKRKGRTMSEGKRPGGLTALAVINFVFFGLGLIGLLGMAASYAGWFPIDKMTEEQKATMEAIQNIPLPMFIFILVFSIVTNVLLLLSGIGYLKQKKFLGRMLGSVYAVLGIVSTIITAVTFPTEAYGGFHIMTMIDLIYPVLTLVLLNTTFKEDLTN